jgi:lipoate-protein ligase A
MTVAVRRGVASALFGDQFPDDPSQCSIQFLEVEAPTVVLGSAQGSIASTVTGAVVRRRSGGGAVWLDDSMIWCDVWVPRGHAWWSDDVGRASWPIGDTVLRALTDLGLHRGVVHRGPMVRPAGSREVCWLGLGSGEVHDGAGRKVVGVAQRRVRAGALFQIGVLLDRGQERLGALVSPPVPEVVIRESEWPFERARDDVLEAVAESFSVVARGPTR